MSRPDITGALSNKGLTLPEAPAPLASYVPAVLVGDLVFVSGQVPLREGALMAAGRVPDEVDLATAQACARQCVLNALAAVRDLIGLERIVQVVKLDGFVACGTSFADHPKVINGASDLLLELMGDAGRHARAATGATSLPLNAPVEVAFTFQVGGA